VTAVSASDPSAVGGAKKARLPATLSPQLATLVDACPSGDRWLHEVKYDGYRMVCRVDRDEVAIYSRNGKDWTAVLGTLAAAVKRLHIRSAWLDGEVVAMTSDGRTSFQRLQNALADPSVGALTYFIFDVPFLDGYDLRGVTLTERKRLLRSILPDTDPLIRYGIEVQGAGDQFFAQACKLGYEGIVSKRADFSITRQRAPATGQGTWVRQEMVIGGLLIHRAVEPVSAHCFSASMKEMDDCGTGRVGTGFDDATSKVCGTRSTSS
jgi:bifunctional non-homologous end joining protein LigD